MTIRYVYHASAQDDSDSTWNSSTISYLTLQAALTAWVSGDFVYMAHDHAESNATTQTYTCSSTISDRCPIYRVNRTSGLYDNSDATVNLTVTTSADFVHSLSANLKGIRYSTGDNYQFSASDQSCDLEDSHITLTSGSAIMLLGQGNADSAFRMINGSITFSTSGWIINNGGRQDFENVDFLGTFASGGLFRPSVGRTCILNLNHCDFTADASATLVDMSTGGSGAAVDITFRGCSLPSGYVVSDSSFNNDLQTIRLIACDIDGASNAKRYKNELHTYRGTVKDNTTTYLNASTGHEDGTTKYSFEMTPGDNGTTDVTPWSPLEGIELQAYISSTGSKTFTVEAVENFTSALDIDEAWMEVYYLGTANSTKYEVGTTKGHLLTTALTAGTGLANWTSYPSGSRSVKFTKTLTVNETGVYVVKIFLGAYEAGKVLHYDSEVTVS